MPYQYKATRDFWQALHALPESQKTSVERAWGIFRSNPFDPRLRTHKIHRLSQHYQQTIYAVRIEGDLRVVFLIKGGEIWTLDVGTHDIYKT